MKQVRNEKGSTLVWAMTIVMIMVILITGALTLANQYHERTLYNTRMRQAQLSAKAAGNMIADALNARYDEDGVSVSLLPNKWDKEGKDTAAIRQIEEIKLPEKMGTVKATIFRVSENSLYIDVTATYQEVDSELRVMMKNKKKEGASFATWTIVKYDDDLKEQVVVDEK